MLPIKRFKKSDLMVVLTVDAGSKSILPFVTV